VYDFLLVINSNLGPISYRYWSFSALVWGDPLRIYGKASRFLKPKSSRQPMVKIWWS